jgi:hypothetical protein
VKFENAVVNHIDENKTNNYYKNLEWTTYKGNMEHSFAKAVVKIDITTGKHIETYKSIALARDSVGKGSGISECCNGKRQSAYGYRWKFLEE